MTAARVRQDSLDKVGNDSVQSSVERLLVWAIALPELPQLRVGCDVCDVAKLRHQLSTSVAQRFLTATFTTGELAYCAGRAERLAARWAAKEAVAKAIGSGFRGLRPSDIEVARHPTGTPYIRPIDGQRWPDNAHEWQWAISLAHENDIAIAVAIAIVRTPQQAYRKMVQPDIISQQKV